MQHTPSCCCNCCCCCCCCFCCCCWYSRGCCYCGYCCCCCYFWGREQGCVSRCLLLSNRFLFAAVAAAVAAAVVAAVADAVAAAVSNIGLYAAGPLVHQRFLPLLLKASLPAAGDSSRGDAATRLQQHLQREIGTNALLAAVAAAVAAAAAATAGF